MPEQKDRRLIIGADVHTYVRFVAAPNVCQLHYGANWKHSTCEGVVESVEVSIGRKKKKTLIHGAWAVGPNKIRKTVLLRNVSLGAYALLKNDEGTICMHGREPDRPFPFEEANTPPSSLRMETTHCNIEPSAEVAAIGNDTRDTSVVTRSPENTINRNLSSVQFESHGRKWVQGEIKDDLNGYVPLKNWEVVGCDQTLLSEGSSQDELTALYCFKSMFPMRYLPKMLSLTNITLLEKKIQPTTCGEILRFFGVLFLMTRYEFGSRRSLWSTETTSRYVTRPHFGIAMSRKRFDALFSNITFSTHANSESDTQRTQRWAPFSDFVSAINEHRVDYVRPSEVLCVDESMIRWYGLGGDLIDIGLPRYVSIDRKPENGCEIKNVSCAKSGIMLRLELVMAEADTALKKYENTCNHGTAVMRQLVEPWQRSHRIVCADSYFASVESSEALLNMGLHFTGVVKTATRGFPMAFLSKFPISRKGQHISMITESIVYGKKLMALCWADRNRSYFISTTGTTLAGNPYIRTRWRKINGKAKRVTFSVDQPRVVKKYFSAASSIDQHNRCRQDVLKLEKKVEVVDWDKRVNFSLLAIFAVDAWKMYQGSLGARTGVTQAEFYERLAAELIDNTYDKVVHKKGYRLNVNPAGSPSSGKSTHLTVTKRFRVIEGKRTNHKMQSRCRSCSRHKSKYVCSTC